MRKLALWEARHPKTVIIAAVLLLIAMIGAIILAKRNPKEADEL